MARFDLRSQKIRLSENDVEKACIDVLRRRDYYPLRLQSGLFKTPDNRWIQIGRKGLPDYVVLHEWRPGFLLETKRPKGELSPAQERLIWELEVAYNLIIATVDSVLMLETWLDQFETKFT